MVEQKLGGVYLERVGFIKRTFTKLSESVGGLSLTYANVKR